MAISLEPFGDAIEKGRKPLCAGEEGHQALEVVDAVYRSCRSNEKVVL
jgi:predicted dehydrogenase